MSRRKLQRILITLAIIALVGWIIFLGFPNASASSSDTYPSHLVSKAKYDFLLDATTSTTELPTTTTIKPLTQARKVGTVRGSAVPTPAPSSLPFIYPSEEAKAYARTLVTDPAQFTCLENLWSRESGWIVGRLNTSSFATGLPQSLPGKKIYGFDTKASPNHWALMVVGNLTKKILVLDNADYKKEVDWGLAYIPKYGSPCGADAFQRSHNGY